MMANDFEEIVGQLYEPLYKFAFSLTRAEADARDLTQHTFYIWALKGHQLREPAKRKTWLFTTLHRAFLETHRRQTRFPQHDLDEVPLDELPAIAPDFAAEADSPQVLSALAKVDKVYQAAVALFYLEDCSYKQIAEILAIPVGTVKSRIARGIRQLRRILRCDESRPGSELPSVQANAELSGSEIARDAFAWEVVPQPQGMIES
jgi:RNA polymerase sigma-70 factor (ECF subfamily)